MGLLSYIFVYNLIILLYVRDMRRFFIFLKNFAIVSSNNIYLDSKYTNVGQPKYCYYHRQTTTPKTHSKKKNNFQSVDNLIQLEQYFCWKPYLCCALPLFMSHPLFPSQNKKINKKKMFV